MDQDGYVFRMFATRNRREQSAPRPPTVRTVKDHRVPLLKQLPHRRVARVVDNATLLGGVHGPRKKDTPHFIRPENVRPGCDVQRVGEERLPGPWQAGQRHKASAAAVVGMNNPE
jgi:hypothetical protein